MTTNVYLDKNYDSENKYWYYTIKKGELIYRGDTIFYSNLKNSYESKTETGDYFMFRDSEYFTSIKQSAELYGLVTKFQISKQLKLLAMDEPESLEFLKKNTTNIDKFLSIAFKIKDDKVIRNSLVEIDRKISKKICKLNSDFDIDGYATNMMKQPDDSLFHAEMMICNPKNKIELLKDSLENYSDEEIESKVMDHKLRLVAPKKRKLIKDSESSSDTESESESDSSSDTESSSDTKSKSESSSDTNIESPPLRRRLMLMDD